MTKRTVEGAPIARGTVASAEDGEAGAGNVEKIRNILFGNQMRDYERQFEHLEARFLKGVAQLREETRRRLEALEGHITKELDDLGGRLKDEHQDREEADRKLGVELANASRILEQNLHEIEERVGETSRDLKQQILEQSRLLTDELGSRCDETTRVLDRTTGELRAGKVDRSALAGMLTSLAMQISDSKGSASDEKE